jgi:tetratricopeptide (TPR) repeat protein
MRNYLLPTALFGSITSGTIFAIAIVSYASPAVALTPVEIQRIAKQSTVQITTGCEVGSGVIIRKDGNTYTVLTVAHTFKKKESCSPLEVVAPDTTKYQIAQVKNFPNNVDLAAFTFTSSKSYAVAKLIDNSDLVEAMETVYVSDFPLSTAINKSTFTIVKGDVIANPTKIQQGKGYSLIYSNNTLPGYSGGAVWNDKGDLIAIHGQGDVDSKLQDTMNNGVRVKTGFNLGITVNTFNQFASSMGLRGGSTPLAIVIKPKLIDDLFASAALKDRRGDYRGVVVDMDRLIALDPQNAYAYYLRGLAKDGIGASGTTILTGFAADHKGALDDYNRAIALNPNYVAAYSQRGSTKEVLGDKKGALSDYNRAIALNPDEIGLYYSRGFIKEQLGDNKGAIADYNRLIARYPNAPDYHARRAIVKSAFGDKRGAIVDYDQVIALGDTHAWVYHNRGIAKFAVGNKQGAISDLRQAAKSYKQEGNIEDYQKVIAELKRIGN